MPSKSRIGRVREALSHLRQRAESVTRSARIDIESSDVDEIDPPSEIDEYHQLYRDEPIIRANINRFVRDVVKPGVRVQAEDDATEAYFMGGDEAPEGAPDGGFLDNAAVLAGERHKPFLPFLSTTVVQKWTRGTALIELLKDADAPVASDVDGERFPRISGFKHIRPETVSARTYANTNILIDPEDTEAVDTEKEITERGEAAAYVQFDERSILGRRGRFDDDDGIPLSQNDVVKEVLNPDIGGDESTEQGVFGTSILEAVAEDAEEYREIKRDRARAIKTKAYGVWSAQFNTEITETPDPNEPDILEEWSEGEQDDWVNNIGDIGPGDIIGHDGSIDLDAWEPQVPELDSTLKHYVNDILGPLPAPKYATAFGEDVANHVSDRQENVYEDTIEQERRYQERIWSSAFRELARRHPDLDPEGIEVKIQPRREDSPIKSLSEEEVNKIETYSKALKNLYPAGPSANLGNDVIRELILRLPEEDRQEAASEFAEQFDDERAEQIEEQFEVMQDIGEEAN